MTNEELKLKLEEAKSTFMVDAEEKYKKLLIKILINKDGRWGPYKHPKYAKRLIKYDLYIVPTSVERLYTASISFDDGAVYVGEGLLSNPSFYYQLNVVIRHELAHNLLMHEMRMMTKLSKPLYTKLRRSASFHDLLNIIMDLEISNRKYTSEDKKIMRHLLVNGEYVTCLVTEDLRKDWAPKSTDDIGATLEEMYDDVDNEIKELKSMLEKALAGNDTELNNYMATKHSEKDDYLPQNELKLFNYVDTTKPSIFTKPLKNSKIYKKLGPDFKALTDNIYEKLEHASEEELLKLQQQVIKMGPIEPGKVADSEVTTPEEKYIAMNVIKLLLNNAVDSSEKQKIIYHRKENSKEYRDAYNEIIKELGKKGQATAEEIAEILSSCSGAKEIVYD